MPDQVLAPLRLFALLTIIFLSLVAVVLGTAALTYVVTTTSKIRDTQLEGTPTGQKLVKSADDTATTLALLQDCLEPEGVCNKRNQANQAAVLNLVREDMFTIAACMEGEEPQTEAQIRACYDKAQSERQKNTP